MFSKHREGLRLVGSSELSFGGSLEKKSCSGALYGTTWKQQSALCGHAVAQQSVLVKLVILQALRHNMRVAKHALRLAKLAVCCVGPEFSGPLYIEPIRPKFIILPFLGIETSRICSTLHPQESKGNWWSTSSNQHKSRVWNPSKSSKSRNSKRRELGFLVQEE